MNKFLYVFNDDLAKKLDSIGYKTYSQEKKEDGESYKLYAEDRNLSTKEIAEIVSSFEIGTDYVFTNKIFFKEGMNE